MIVTVIILINLQTAQSALTKVLPAISLLDAGLSQLNQSAGESALIRVLPTISLLDAGLSPLNQSPGELV